MKKILFLTAVAFITIAAFVYSLWHVDLRELALLLSNGNYWLLLANLGILLVYFWLRAIRWAIILRPLGNYAAATVAPAMMIGFASNNLVPGHLGELIRTVFFSRQFRQSKSGVLVSIALERILDVIGILFVYFCGVLIAGTIPQSLQLGLGLIFIVLIGSFLVIILLLLNPDAVLNLWVKLSWRFPEHIQIRIRHILRNSIKALSTFKSPTMVIILCLHSILIWCLASAMVWISLAAYGSLVPVEVAMITLAVISIAYIIPNAPGYVGAIQAAYVFALSPFGIPHETAFAASVFFLIGQWVPVTAIGAVFFFIHGIRPSVIREEVKNLEAN